MEAVDLDRMCRLLADRGPDETGVWSNSQVGLVQTMLRTTPESILEHQPTADESGQVVVVLDGRLDYRSELRNSLERSGYHPRDTTDVELLIGAYLRWDNHCASRLLGDFAFVVWDGRRRRIFCGRDRLGIRPFYYHLGPRVFAWSSDLPALLALPGLHIEPNLGMVAEHLADAITSHEDTLYAGVSRLPPAHVLVVDEDRIRKVHYWDPEPSDDLRHLSAADAADQLLELVTDAVQCRLRSIAPVSCELSGGLDSSSVTGLAAALSVAHGVSNLHTVSVGLQPNENILVDEVADMWSLRNDRLTTPPAGEFDFFAHVSQLRDLPAAPSAASTLAMWRCVADAGTRVVLAGEGPDEWFTGSGLWIADTLRAGKLNEAALLVRGRSRQTKTSAGGLAWSYGLRPLLAQASPAWLRSAVRGRQGGAAPWLTPDFRQGAGLSDRLASSFSDRHWPTLAQRELYSKLHNGYMTHAFEWGNRVSSWCGVERRMPFEDARVVNFAFALPEGLRSNADAPKSIVRAAMKGVLPASIRDRTDKGDASWLIAAELLSPWCRKLFENLAVEQQGWVDGARARAMLAGLDQSQKRASSCSAGHLFPLWSIVGIELWFRTEYGRR